LTDPTSLEELRMVARGDEPERLISVLERLLGVRVSPDEARDIVYRADKLVRDVAERLKHRVIVECAIIIGD
jgi:hypothetical protein